MPIGTPLLSLETSLAINKARSIDGKPVFRCMGRWKSLILDQRVAYFVFIERLRRRGEEVGVVTGPSDRPRRGCWSEDISYTRKNPILACLGSLCSFKCDELINWWKSKSWNRLLLLITYKFRRWLELVKWR